ncbi:MAG TPA: hypothetical protein VIW02_02530 [Gammaproteobacteria bacterium]
MRLDEDPWRAVGAPCPVLPDGETPRLPSTYYTPRAHGLAQAGMALRALAVHEAAHAVTSELTGGRVHGVVLYPNVVTPPGQPQPVGQTYATSPTRGLEPGSEGYAHAARRRAVMLLAGCLAEREYLGIVDGGGQGDDEAALALLDRGVATVPPEQAHAECVQLAARLLAQPAVRQSILAVAEALVRRGRLAGDEVRAAMFPLGSRGTRLDPGAAAAD